METGGHFMTLCDLCEQAKECLQKEIEEREYDICSECWKPLAAKLKGKGRLKKERETVLVPATTSQPERENPAPHPLQPPKIWGYLEQPQARTH
jgi:hypothetical protein